MPAASVTHLSRVVGTGSHHVHLAFAQVGSFNGLAG